MTHNQPPLPGYRGLTAHQVAQIERALATPGVYGPVLVDELMITRNSARSGETVPDSARSETGTGTAGNRSSSAMTPAQCPIVPDFPNPSHRRARGRELSPSTQVSGTTGTAGTLGGAR